MASQYSDGLHAISDSGIKIDVSNTDGKAIASGYNYGIRADNRFAGGIDITISAPGALDDWSSDERYAASAGFRFNF